MQYDSAQSVRWKFADGNQRRFGNPVCGVRSHENTPAHEVKKWTNVGEFVHPFAIFDGQNEYCYVVDFVQESIGPLSWYLGVAPERGQAFGNKARQSLAELCFRKQARAEIVGIDRYNRWVSLVSCDGIDDVNLELVQRGFAWRYPEYSRDPAFSDAERDAREQGRGLWVDPAPMEPWVWRKLKRSQSATSK